MIKKFAMIILCLSLAVTVFIMIAGVGQDTATGIRDESGTDGQDASKIEQDYAQQKRQSGKTAAWLNVPNICYYPVMYSGDNSFYLEHNHLDEPDVAGAVFINKGCKPDFNSKILLIHGHNMADGRMFANLDRYMGEDFFRENPAIQVFDGGKLRFYQPFTVFLLEDGKEYIELDQKSGEDHAAYLESLKQRSLCRTDDNFIMDTDKNAIFLSTCNYAFEDARLIIGAVEFEIEK